MGGEELCMDQLFSNISHPHFHALCEFLPFVSSPYYAFMSNLGLSWRLKMPMPLNCGAKY